MASRPTRPRICPETESQSPLRQLCSTAAITFCMNTDGMELTTALKRMHATVTGSITG